MRPSKRPKHIKIFITQEIYDILTRLAELDEKCLSPYVAEILEALLPGLKHNLMMQEEVHKLDSQARNNLSKSLERHEQHLSQAVEYTQQNSEKDIKQHKLPL